MINIKSVFVKNFMSFGNTWQELPIRTGINLIQGYDVNTKKSNGSGKTNAMEAISFALYGQTVKAIKKDKIRNWDNNTKCEVRLLFDMNGDEYEFYRSIKPNKFIVKRNEEEIPILSNIRDFQNKINDEILGMDFQSFKNLVYYSPNNTISIIKSPREQKRKFLESLFDLSVYSKMYDLCNKKIASNKNSTIELEKEIHTIKSNIDIIDDNIRSREYIDTDVLKAEINKTKNMISMLADDIKNYDPSEYKRLVSELEVLKRDKKDCDSNIMKIEMEINHIKDMMDSIDIERLESEYNTKRKEIAEIESDIEDLNKALNEANEDELHSKKSDISDKIKSLKETLSQFKIKRERIKIKIQNVESDINSCDGNDIDSDICPLCKQNVDHEHLKSWYENKKKELISEKNHLISILKKADERISKLDKDIQECSDEISNIDERLKCIDDLRKKLDILLNKNSVLKENAISHSDIDEYKKRYESYLKKINELKRNNNEMIEKSDLINQDILIKNDLLEIEEDHKRVFDKKTSELNRLEGILNEKKDRLKSAEDSNQRISDLNKKDSDTIDELSKKLKLYKKDLKKNESFMQYFTYIKESLKDNNIRQYAIKSILPFLNERANHYLSESGFPYLINVDGWLDVTINGYGVDDVEYDSLSGGERKSIDLALQFASNDVSLLQAKNSFNISILDEIMDTSLDDTSLSMIMDIIRVRQKENSLAVYIVTHKDGAKDMEYDGYVYIEKKDGFSAINVE